MKTYLAFLLLIFLSCEKKPRQENKTDYNSRQEHTLIVSPKENDVLIEKKFLDSIYNCESKNFVSLLEEIPNRHTDAYNWQ